MIDWLIFSRDRPMQLEACIDSLLTNAASYIRSIGVLYHSTAPEYDQGYGICRLRYPQAWFVPEVYFPEQVVGWLRQATDTVGFLCDDDVFYRASSVLPDIELPFSFRLGLNCTAQHPTGMQQEMTFYLIRQHRDIETLCWEWRGGEGDWGYPFSLDGQVYEKKQALSLLTEGVFFTDPTTLEANAVSKVIDGNTWPEYMHSFSKSHVVSVPMNRVTVNSRNPIMGQYDVAELNYSYLRGSRLDWRAMQWSLVNGAHAEVPYVFTT